MEHDDYVEITMDLDGVSVVLKIDEKNSKVKSPKLDLSEGNFARNVAELRRIIPNSSLKPSLRFLDGVPWKSVEKRFRESAVDGVLAKDKFGVVIGMEDSEEFAMEIYNVFAKRLRLNTSNGIEMEVMNEIWSLLNSQDFEVQLQLFFDFCDKNGDGKLSEEEICEAIELSASTNKLFDGSSNKFKSEAADYATLIMKELDPDDLGFIEIRDLETLFSRHMMRTSINYESRVEMLRALKRTTFPENFWKSVSSTKNIFQTWMHLMVPVCYNAYDRGLTFMNLSHPVMFVKVAIYQGKVLVLYMKKPYGFKYKIGMYLLFKCPMISSSEWHPFSIVSAPDDDCICVLISTSMGEWAATLQEIFETTTTSPFDQSSVNRDIGNARVESDSDLQPKMREQSLKQDGNPHIIMKGPYGVPAQDYKKYDIVLLIGFGLGATLNFSILQDLLNNLQKSRTQGKERKKVPYKTYFYWVTSNQISFDVFKGVFDETAKFDSDNVIEMNNYLTSVYKEGDARSALIKIAQSLQYAKNGFDVISGTRIKTHFVTPNWTNVLAQLATKHKSQKIGVYYSGSKEQMKLIRKLCKDFSQNTTHFHFHFQKEN